MSGTAKHEYLAAIKPRYRKASRKEKQAILDECCTICGYHRKHRSNEFSNLSLSLRR